MAGRGAPISPMLFQDRSGPGRYGLQYTFRERYGTRYFPAGHIDPEEAVPLDVVDESCLFQEGRPNESARRVSSGTWYGLQGVPCPGHTSLTSAVAVAASICSFRVVASFELFLSFFVLIGEAT